MSTHPPIDPLPDDAAKALRVVIVVSRYNASVTHALLDGAVARFHALGGVSENLAVIPVPGAYELTAGAAMATSMRPDAVVALGCVIKGETDHDLHISQAVAQGLTRVSIDARTPVAFGVLTTRTAEQAIERATSAGGGKGAEAMAAAIETARASRLVSDKAHDPWKAFAAHSFAHGETDKASGGGDH
ncbi:MAG: 6,7-dimethyl-8-ribityllumazine synthase [Planctomycetota bacterium]